VLEALDLFECDEVHGVKLPPSRPPTQERVLV
jgi:hypothetical protein